ncbi:hypothetical protein N7486_000545 [Penicillium sp. IBT 16267x]|nr:hypothetical protein N7486_000545 [Penicillium sp. IBT 16267x]
MGGISTFRRTSGFGGGGKSEEPAEEDEWDSEANDYESSVPDTVATGVEDDDPPQDTPADEREQYIDFDGPFAVVI